MTIFKCFFKSSSHLLSQQLFECCDNFSVICLLFCHDNWLNVATNFILDLVFSVAFLVLFVSFDLGFYETTNLVKTS